MRAFQCHFVRFVSGVPYGVLDCCGLSELSPPYSKWA